jgi:hypothetical protein
LKQRRDWKISKGIGSIFDRLGVYKERKTRNDKKMSKSRIEEEMVVDK